ncbi:MAG: response regulator [Alphaproteobacteria bacterium]|nr:response regulator [Alphaproteobacteria bacterium]
MTARRLIVCDDEPDFRAFIRKVAESMNFEVREVSNPAACVGEVAVFRPDILVLDIVMPDMDGIEIVQSLDKAAFEGRVLIASGYDPHYATSAASLGKLKGVKTEILSKPVHVADLKAKLAT